MTIFSKITDNSIMTTIVTYTRGKGFKFIQAHTPPTASKVRPGSSLVCMYRYPSGDYGAKLLSELFQDQLVSGYYELTCADVWELYSHWRRAYASGYDHSEIFNAYGVRLPNPFVPARQTPSFDIRLGHCITCDITARRLIGTDTSPFTPASP